MIIKSSFTPSTFIKNPHLQTVWPRFFNRVKTYSTERLELVDGDFLDLSWSGNPDSNQPIVIIFHGLEGSINSPYIQGIMREINNNKWVGVLMHFRSCSDEMNRLDRSYHSGDTNDIRYCINHIRLKFPQNPLFAIGYSLGGNALLKYLGEQQEDCSLQTAIAVSVPYELNRGADKLNQGLSKFYQWYLVGKLRNKMREKSFSVPSTIELSQLETYRSFWDFDHHVTAPIHGFTSATEYYSLSSSRQYLPRIKTHTHMIHAKDDPFLPIDAIPKNNELPSEVTLELSDNGGHVGFITGNNPLRPIFWLEQRIPEIIHEQLIKTH